MGYQNERKPTALSQHIWKGWQDRPLHQKLQHVLPVRIECYCCSLHVCFILLLTFFFLERKVLEILARTHESWQGLGGYYRIRHVSRMCRGKSQQRLESIKTRWLSSVPRETWNVNDEVRSASAKVHWRWKILCMHPTKSKPETTHKSKSPPIFTEPVNQFRHWRKRPIIRIINKTMWFFGLFSWTPRVCKEISWAQWESMRRLRKKYK